MALKRIGGSDSDVVFDNFGDNTLDQWFTNGTIVADDFKAKATIAAGGGADYISQSFTAGDEFWYDGDVFISSTGLVITNAIIRLGYLGAGASYFLRLSVEEVTSVLRWRTEYRNVGIVSNTYMGIVAQLGKWYTATLHYKLETGPGVLDGIAEIWIDDGTLITKILDISNHQFNDTQMTDVIAGNSDADAIVEGTIYADNIKVGTTGSAPSRELVGGSLEIEEILDITGIL